MKNTAPVYRVTVGNIGEVYAGNSQTEARVTFSTYKAQSLANEGRAAAEIVTLWEHGHPVRELVPVVYDCELTDTFAGEANYSWGEALHACLRHRADRPRPDPGRQARPWPDRYQMQG